MKINKLEKEESKVLDNECGQCGSKEFKKDEFNRVVCSFCKTIPKNEKRKIITYGKNIDKKEDTL